MIWWWLLFQNFFQIYQATLSISSSEYPTSSFFQYSEPSFEKQGYAIELIPAADAAGQCRLGNTSTTGQIPAVVVIDFASSHCHFACISQTFQLFQEYRQDLARLNSSLPDTLIVVGITSMENYTAPKFGIYDGPPPSELKVQLMDNSTFLKRLPARVKVVQEPGLWNMVFLSSPYLATMRSLELVLSLAVVVFGLYFFFKTFYHRPPQAKEQPRTSDKMMIVIISSALLSGIVSLVLLETRIFSAFTKRLEIVLILLNITSFYVLLFLWTVLYKQVYPSSCAIFLLQIQIVAGKVGGLLTSALGFYEGIYLALQCLTAVLFISFALSFHIHQSFQVTEQEQEKSSMSVVRRLEKLTLVALACFLWLILIGLTKSANLEGVTGFAIKRAIMGFLNIGRCLTFYSILFLL